MDQTVTAGAGGTTPASGGNETITGGRLLGKALKAEGVDVIFTLTGGEIVDVYDGCINEGIKIIDVRHEQVAAHAAEGYSRITGKTGVAVVTAGIGTTNAISGVANAFGSESAMLLIGGFMQSDQRRRNCLGDLPHTAILRPITKFAEVVPSTAQVAEMTSMAFRECYNGAPGPSYLEMPVDVLRSSIDVSKARVPVAGHYKASTKTYGNANDVERLATMLAASERPCVLFGSQLWTCKASDVAVEFCRQLNLPAFASGSARGTFTAENPHGFQHTRRNAFEKADLIVVFGLPFDFRMGYGKSLPANTPIVQIDLDYRMVGKNHDVTVGIVGDTGEVMKKVLEILGSSKDNGARRREPWLEHLRVLERKAGEVLATKLHSNSRPIHPLRLAYEINEFLTKDSIFIGDAGDVLTFAGPVILPKAAGKWFDTGPMGTLGVGTPFAMAAKVAHPDQEVVGLFGDGSFAMTGFDFETCVRFNLPFIGIIGNNSYMNQPRFGTKSHLGAEYGDVATKLGDIPYGEFAKMLGGYGEDVRDPDQIQPALRRARDSGKCALINVWVDPEVFSPGTSRQTMYK
ncbi:MAG: thiamine pyrophosphate-binding protein [Azospirillaceae bacterium]|nr:thiamine pyrophosphate-binding protein [Azospirillaceae bacterium]